jgi:hypothetical protein
LLSKYQNRYRSLFHLFGDQQEKSGFIDIFDNYCPYLNVPAEDAEDGLLRSSSAMFSPNIPDNLPFILPHSSEIGFINLDCAGEDVRYILREDHSDFEKCPEHSLLIETGLFNN